jgi:hypothetical protein
VLELTVTFLWYLLADMLLPPIWSYTGDAIHKWDLLLWFLLSSTLIGYGGAHIWQASCTLVTGIGNYVL